MYGEPRVNPRGLIGTGASAFKQQLPCIAQIASVSSVSLVVGDNPPMSPPPSSFGGLSPNLVFGLFFTPFGPAAVQSNPAAGAVAERGRTQRRKKGFDRSRVSGLEYQAFRASDSLRGSWQAPSVPDASAFGAGRVG